MVEELTKSIKSRHINLDCISPILTGDLNIKGKPQRLCAWCCEEEILSGSRKYCGNLCAESARAWAYPQKEEGIKFLLIRQDWKCNICQYNYRVLYEQIMKKEGKTFNGPVDPKVYYWYYYIRLKNKLLKEFKIEVDHIVPIYKGGDSLGLENHQLICYTCHKEKTKKDLSGKRKKLDKTIKIG